MRNKGNTLFIDGKERTAQIGEKGYMFFWLTDGSGIMAHRAVMEQHLGRKLKSNEHIHHLDGDRTNNDITNLVILTRGEHSRLHRLKEVQEGKILFGGNNEKRKRKIVGMNAQGVVLRFDSFREARKNGFSHAFDCCHGTRKTDKGFSWRYDDEY